MRNKIFFTLAITLLVVMNTYGQSSIPGLVIGGNYSRFNTEQITGNGGFGFDLGFNMLSPLSDRFDLLSELIFSKNTASLEGWTIDSDHNKTFFPDYSLSVIGAKITIIGNYYLKAPNFSLQAGMVLGKNYKINSNYTAEEIYFGPSDDPVTAIASSELQNGIKKGIDYGIAFGISGGSEALRLNLRYYIGLKNYYKYSDNNQSGYTIKNNIVQLTLSYSLRNRRIIN